MPSIINIVARYDSDAKVWVASSDDVAGLHAEAADFDELKEIVKDLVPALLFDQDENVDSPTEIPVHLTANYDFIASMNG